MRQENCPLRKNKRKSWAFTKKDEYIVFAVKRLKMNLLKRWKTIENESAWLKFDGE